MRINVHGEIPSCQTLKLYLEFNGYQISATDPFLTVTLDHHEKDSIVIDGRDCEFERLCINRISALTPMQVSLQRHGGVQSDQAIRVVFPNKPEPVDAVERGVLAAVMVITKHDANFSPTVELEKTMRQLEESVRHLEGIIGSVKTTHDGLLATVEERLVSIQAEVTKRYQILTRRAAEQAEAAPQSSASTEASRWARLKSVFR